MKTRVVIVDDNLSFCQSMSFMFEILTDYKVLVYNNAVDFLTDYTLDWKGFVLIDLLMPTLSGLALIEKLKKLNSKLYIIAISGHADTSIINNVLQKGADDFLLKPFDVSKFLEKISSVAI